MKNADYVNTTPTAHVRFQWIKIPLSTPDNAFDICLQRFRECRFVRDSPAQSRMKAPRSRHEISLQSARRNGEPGQWKLSLPTSQRSNKVGTLSFVGPPDCGKRLTEYSGNNNF